MMLKQALAIPVSSSTAPAAAAEGTRAKTGTSSRS